MEKELIICDTNILIDYFKQTNSVVEEIDKIEILNVVISVVTEMEIYQGAFNKQDLVNLEKKMRVYTLLYLNDDISKLASGLMKDFSLSHQLKIPDALIAASAIHFNLKLFTHNKKDFRYLPGIKLY